MKKQILLPSLLLLVAVASQAQWQPDMRLTDDIATSATSANKEWCIAASGDTLHVVWNDNRDGNMEIYYKRSTDRGITWGADTRLTNDASNSVMPSVALSGSVLHIVWQDNRDGNDEVYHKVSPDKGASWGTDERLTNNSGESAQPVAVVSGNAVHIVWRDNRDGNNEVYYKRSTDGGASWETDFRLTNNASWSGFPSLCVSDSVVHVTWDDHRDGNAEVYYKRSTDSGASWGTDVRLTNDAAGSYDVFISVTGQVGHIIWSDVRDGNAEIYYKRTTDGGVSWGTDTRLTTSAGDAWYPSLAVSGSLVHAVWYDERDGNAEIYYKQSPDGGMSWEADTRLTADSAESYDASAAASGSDVHVVWRDNRDGNFEIYYKRYTDSLGTAVFPVYMQPFTVYPNPASGQLRVSAINTNEDFLLLNVTGQTVLKEHITFQEQTIDISALEPGVYVWRMGGRTGKILLN